MLMPFFSQLGRSSSRIIFTFGETAGQRRPEQRLDRLDHGSSPPSTMKPSCSSDQASPYALTITPARHQQWQLQYRFVEYDVDDQFVALDGVARLLSQLATVQSATDFRESGADLDGACVSFLIRSGARRH
ncbi:hypothetical protein ACXX9E_29670 [Pseudomonas sp. GNP014]